MEWLNYHHLLYFWTVAKEGGVTAAARALGLSQPTLSAQIRALETAFGEKLLQKSGRTVVLTEAGRTVLGYAEDIFAIGDELKAVMKGRPGARAPRVTVGISDVLPKLMVQKLLEPALGLPEEPLLDCVEDKTEALLADLMSGRLDLVLADRPLSPQSRIRAFNHMLGECGVSVYAASSLARRLKGPFPACLAGASWLLPSQGTALRRGIDQWMRELDLHPRIRGEFNDSALLKAFGHAGAGLFVAPDAIHSEVARQYGATRLGPAEGVRERIYALSLERRLRHPAVVAISSSAKSRVFS
jgi:LysR family transcriptional activator of nhaA